MLRHRLESELNAATHGRDADSKKSRERGQHGAIGGMGVDVCGRMLRVIWGRGCKEH